MKSVFGDFLEIFVVVFYFLGFTFVKCIKSMLMILLMTIDIRGKRLAII